jgi:hypothetical protein
VQSATFLSGRDFSQTLEGAMNSLFLFARFFRGEHLITLAIGSKNHSRKIRLSSDEALKIACRLMSAANGGETQGFKALEDL